MSRIAFVTFGILREREDHPQVQGFVDRSGGVFATADASSGLIDRYRGRDDEYRAAAAGDRFGAYATGRFRDARPRRPRGADVVAVDGPGVGLRLRLRGSARRGASAPHRVVPQPAWPTFVAWWVADEHWPDWREANARLEHLHDHGASAIAFDFRSPFDTDGRPTDLDRRRVAALRGG